MLKFWLTLSLLMLAIAARADEKSVRRLVEAAYPSFKIDSVVKTEFAGLYEVYLGGQIIYTDEQVKFIIAEGRLVEIKSKRDLTTERLDVLNRIDFKTLPLEQAIKVVKGDGSRKIAVFSDVDCPYCKVLERNAFNTLSDITIYTFLYPIDSNHPDATRKSQMIWCAPNRSSAWQDWMLRSELPKIETHCETPLAKIKALATRLNVTSTPTLFFSDGRRLLGAQPLVQIERALEYAKKQEK